MPLLQEAFFYGKGREEGEEREGRGADGREEGAMGREGGKGGKRRKGKGEREGDKGKREGEGRKRKEGEERDLYPNISYDIMKGYGRADWKGGKRCEVLNPLF